MASGVRNLLQADVAVSVTGLAGPGGDEFGNPVGTVCIGYADKYQRLAKQYRFFGDREEIREQAVRAALELVLEVNS
jgi:nicotinamide-nucleotide amidase